MSEPRSGLMVYRGQDSQPSGKAGAPSPAMKKPRARKKQGGQRVCDQNVFREERPESRSTPAGNGRGRQTVARGRGRLACSWKAGERGGREAPSGCGAVAEPREGADGLRGAALARDEELKEDTAGVEVTVEDKERQS